MYVAITTVTLAHLELAFSHCILRQGNVGVYLQWKVNKCVMCSLNVVNDEYHFLVFVRMYMTAMYKVQENQGTQCTYVRLGEDELGVKSSCISCIQKARLRRSI